ncbi:hypothetical protein QYF61_004210 [Mycteria americana]|uniref:Uncharacterized protein n=1 Tax=Mycteria americana TaxID=33587 RepID=A0AAN7S096_MYCAM|nr:hypothetical protein QYF61_004210 [Mycteria americana]
MPLVTGLHLDIEPLTATLLSVTMQPSPYPPSGPSVKPMSLQFRDKDVVRDSIKCFAQVQSFIPWYSTKQMHEEAKVCSPEVPGSELAVLPPCCPKDLELHHFMVTAAKAALELHIPHQPLLVGENKVQHSASPRLLLYHLEKEVIINTFQEPPGLLMPCCVVPPTDISVVEVPHEVQGLLDPKESRFIFPQKFFCPNKHDEKAWWHPPQHSRRPQHRSIHSGPTEGGTFRDSAGIGTPRKTWTVHLYMSLALSPAAAGWTAWLDPGPCSPCVVLGMDPAASTQLHLPCSATAGLHPIGKSQYQPAPRRTCCWPVVKTMVRQAVSLQPMEVNGGADIHLQPVEDSTLEQVDAQRRP